MLCSVMRTTFRRLKYALRGRAPCAPAHAQAQAQTHTDTRTCAHTMTAVLQLGLEEPNANTDGDVFNSFKMQTRLSMRFSPSHTLRNNVCSPPRPPSRLHLTSVIYFDFSQNKLYSCSRSRCICQKKTKFSASVTTLWNIFYLFIFLLEMTSRSSISRLGGSQLGFKFICFVRRIIGNSLFD